LDSKQAELNLGFVGHVDHGKTTLCYTLTGKWADTHSEEMKRGITIRLGYADFSVYKCSSCKPPARYTVEPKCPTCGGKAELVRKIAIVDAPGHETLMTVMISGAAVMDGAVLVIAANEPCPQPQTAEHLAALDIIGVKKIVIAQNKIDLVSKERALKSYKEIQNFVKGTVAENAPIVPLVAHYKTNLDALLEAIEKTMPTPERDLKSDYRMYICRSFDINKPGTPIEKLKGGVVGGSLVKGTLKIGDEIELKPGISREEKYKPMVTQVTSLSTCGVSIKEASPGGLIGVGTKLDPALTKTDMLVGNLVGKPGTLPDILTALTLELNLLDHVIGVKEKMKVNPVRPGETLVLSVGTTTTIGTCKTSKKKRAEFNLKRPVCAEKGLRVSISRRVGNRWHLIGYGIIE
jgi:translation initiation factor 2 subunit 3